MVGYARVSTSSQTVEQQIDALQAAGVAVVYGDEGISGARRDRPGLDAALDDLRAGDVLCVVALDRLGRSFDDLHEIAKTIKRKGAHIVALRQGVDTRTTIGRAVYRMLATFAELERDFIAERTAEKLASMKRRGLPIGRKPALTAAQVESARRELASGVSAAQVARNLGCGRSTLYRHLGALHA